MKLDYFKYVYEKIVIMFKNLIEFKVNLYLALILEPTFIGFSLIGLFVLARTGAISSWSFGEYVLFMVFFAFVLSVNDFATDRLDLKSDLKDGSLNTLMFRPAGPFFLYATDFMSFNIAGMIFDLGAVVVTAIVLGINALNLAVAVTSLVISAFVFMSAIWFMQSFNFYTYGLGDPLDQTYSALTMTTSRFPPNIFGKTPIRFALFSLPTFFVAYLSVPIAQGAYSIDTIYYFLTMIAAFAFFYGFARLNWKIGLKRYEGYN